MDLLEDGFDADFCIDNVDGAMFGDIYYLNYYGINVFFYVCGTDTHRVRVYELAKKRGKINGESAECLTLNFRPTKAPYFVYKHNCWTKSEFWLETTTENRIIVPIDMFSPIHKKVLDLGIDFPITGYAYAVKIEKEQRKNILSYYWEAPKKIKKQKINKIKISA